MECGSPESGVVESATALPEHCLRLAKKQYETLCNLRNNPLFNKFLLTPSSSPSSSSSSPYVPWDKLLGSKTPHNDCLSWRIHHYWLGSLKFALLSTSVEEGEKLYRNVFTIYEILLSNFEADAKLIFPPRSRKLAFDHVGHGVFQLRLTGFESGKSPSAVGKSPPVATEEDCRRKVRVLASEAVHVSRGSPWPKFCRDPTVGLPLTLLEEEGVGFSPEGLDDASVGPDSTAYQRELCRTVAYIAEQMEARGDGVHWDYLYTGLVADEHPKMFLSSLSKRLDEFIEDNLLQS